MPSFWANERCGEGNQTHQSESRPCLRNPSQLLTLADREITIVEIIHTSMQSCGSLSPCADRATAEKELLARDQAILHAPPAGGVYLGNLYAY